MKKQEYKLFLLVFCFFSFFSQLIDANSLFSDSTFITLPKGTVEGRLKNGLHYLILENSSPASRVEFRLVMRVGSLQELENQKGSAHFLEHVAFGGTTHFPQNSLVEYLESLGMKYGLDINAVTGFDRTVYMFAVPADYEKEKTIDHSLLIMKDWLGGISINKDKVEREKGVILQELNGYDVGDDFYSLKIGDGRYNNRMPLGDIHDINSMTPEKLRDYYETWYSPSNASLVVVGDISPKEIEKKIKKEFSTLKNRKKSSIIAYPLDYQKGIHIKEVKDSLLDKATVELIIPHPTVVVKTMPDAVKKAQGNLLILALNKRFRARKLNVYASDHWYLSDKNHFVLSIKGNDKTEIIETISQTISELHFLIANGWHKEEFLEVKNDFLAGLDEDDNQDRYSSDWCDDFIDYILSGDKHLTSKSDLCKQKALLKHTQCFDLQTLLKEWISSKKEVLLVTNLNPWDEGIKLNEKEIETAWRQGEESEPPAYSFSPKEKEESTIKTPSCLTVEHPFDVSRIKGQKRYAGLGVLEVELKNGIRLILKPTSGNEETVICGYAPIGLSSLSKSEYPLLEGVAGYIDMGGIAKVEQEELDDFLYDKNMSVSVFIDNHWHGISGVSPSNHISEFFNLLKEKLFYPELNYSDFEEVRKSLLVDCDKESTLEKMLKRSPDRQLMAQLNQMMGMALSNSTEKLSKEQIESLNLDSIASYYKCLYANLSDMTFVFAGNFNEEEVIQKFVGTFGNISFEKRREQKDSPLFQLPKGKNKVHFQGESDSQTTFNYVYSGYYQPGLRSGLTLKLMRDVLRNRLLKVLREEEGLVYSPYVSLSYRGYPQGIYFFDINASTNNKNMEKVSSLLNEIIVDLQQEEVSEEELNTLKRSFLIAKREFLNPGACVNWKNTLIDLLQNGEMLEDFNNYEENLKAITPKMLKEGFSRYVNPEEYLLLYQNNEEE